MTNLLFVYGTLMTSAAGAPLGVEQRARLHGESRSLGAATIPGRLVDFGRYPGLLAPNAAGEVVHGEVFELADPAASFAWLDLYEMIDAARTDNEYERALCTVRLADGRDVTASAYLYRADVSKGRVVESGRWVGV